MKVKVGINGFGRIGRILFRLGFDDVEIVGINSLDSIEGAAHLLKYDSSHGTFKRDVKVEGNHLIVDGKRIGYSAKKNPAEIPWKDWGADIVPECTGAFRGKEDTIVHLQGGAKRVLISAPAEGVDKTIVYGVNHETYDPKTDVVLSNASCTTNCLAPVAKVIHERFGIENGFMTTVHAFTSDQRILDSSHKDLRRARTATSSIIPTTTGAAKAVGEVLPELKGKIDGVSVRVPTQNVSLVDFTVNLKSDVTKASLNQAFKEAAAQGPLKGVLSVEDAPLVSVDYNGNTFSSIVDTSCTMVINSRLAKVFSWYDNESGFSKRMIDLAKYMAAKGF